ncbi:MC004 [Molluscum contagiosum virus subtype 1]|uniref:MC004L n=1 Tax=Molluscum contagiosum virus TaxID=10279 RepID=A0A858A3P3_9POXV|nr:MC004 [Molluscum contagiosum virus subtype 1]QHW17799.1 MC004L [Molluscum contagiosum virus]AYO88313.1 MC004 [Molluscum contagiosum virus subtype 1]AYO88489.1 MC004 [Molluscum contagiosum virus subtype 1]AYO88843.1 MC004 [Molluscum contagiosum virus subtype 1]
MRATGAFLVLAILVRARAHPARYGCRPPDDGNETDADVLRRCRSCCNSLSDALRLCTRDLERARSKAEQYSRLEEQFRLAVFALIFSTAFTLAYILAHGDFPRRAFTWMLQLLQRRRAANQREQFEHVFERAELPAHAAPPVGAPAA